MDNFELQCTFPNGQRLAFPLTVSRLVVGNSEQADLRIVSPALAQQHFVVEQIGDQITITDLNTSAGTFINGRRLSVNVANVLTSRDALTIGDLSFQVVMPTAPKQPIAAPIAIPLNNSSLQLSSSTDVLRPGQTATVTLNYSGNQPQEVYFRSHAQHRNIGVEFETENRTIAPGEQIETQVKVRKFGLFLKGGRYSVALIALTASGIKAVQEINVKIRPRYELLALALLLLGSSGTAALAGTEFFQQVFGQIIETIEPTATLSPVVSETPVPVTESPSSTSTATETPTPTPTLTLTPTSTPTGTLPPLVNNCASLGWPNYVVRAGDTLGQLAALTGASVGQIVAANGLRDANLISVGQIICLPRIPAQSPPPTANFDLQINNVNEACTFVTVTFTNLSEGATSFIWDFGDGQRATTVNADHDYDVRSSEESITFTVTLTAIGPGGVDATSRSFTLPEACFPPPVAIFTHEPGFSEDLCNRNVRFFNVSEEAFRYRWDFGDGQSSITPSPTHTYTFMDELNPTYTVTLTAIGLGGQDTAQAEVSVAFNPICMATEEPQPEPLADFNFDPIGEGLCEQSVFFANRSLDATSYSWDFDDGGGSDEENPTHTYVFVDELNPTYVVTLTAIGPGGQDTAQAEVSVTFDSDCIVTEEPLPEPIAAFNFDPFDEGLCEQSVFFANLSQNATSYSWNFGDGSGSAEEDPTHTYVYVEALNPAFTVTLTAFGPGEQQDVAQTTVAINFDPSCIVTEEPLPEPIAAFNFDPRGQATCEQPVFFANQSQNATSYSWSFGDGGSSSEESPTHTYRFIAGSLNQSYGVILTAFGSGGQQDTARTTVNVTYDESCIAIIDLPPLPDAGDLVLEPINPDGSVEPTVDAIDDVGRSNDPTAEPTIEAINDAGSNDLPLAEPTLGSTRDPGTDTPVPVEPPSATLNAPLGLSNNAVVTENR